MNTKFDVFQRDLQRQTILTILENKIKDDPNYTLEQKEKVCGQIKQLASELWAGAIDRREFISKFKVILGTTVKRE